MSIKYMTAVWESNCITEPRMLLVLLALADHANDDGVCWPSMARIAHHARCGERQAKRVIKKLCSLNATDGKPIVEIIHRGGGLRRTKDDESGRKGRSHRYKLNMTQLSLLRPAKGDRSAEKVTKVPVNGDAQMSPESLLGTSKENRQGKEEKIPTSKGKVSEMKKTTSYRDKLNLGKNLLDDCSVASTAADVDLANQAIKFIARDENVSLIHATALLRGRIRNAQTAGFVVNGFWFRDGHWSSLKLKDRNRPSTPAEKMAREDEMDEAG